MFYKRISCIVFAYWSSLVTAASQSMLPPLLVSDNGHLLQQRFETKEAVPFFWLGDTAWELFEGLNRKEAVQYLNDRQKKQFNVIQAHLLPWELKDLNALGERVFIDDDFDRPNPKYWQHVDYIMQQASARGFYLAVLPAWCKTYIEPNNAPLHDNPEKAYRYGRFLGIRYKTYKNLIWVLGGDNLPSNESVYRELARGLTETYAGSNRQKIMMTYHPPGGTWRPPATSSGEFFHHQDWLDFNMIQSGHAVENANYLRITQDYNRLPAKPTLDAEPCYEQHPVKHDFKNGHFSPWHLRRRAYWSVLAGACGFTYGGNGIWQMDKPGRISLKTHFKDYWYDALKYQGAGQMQYVKQLAGKYQFENWIPDSTLISGSIGKVDDRIQSIRTADRSGYIHYVTNGRDITIKPLPDGKWKYHWFDPRSGKIRKAQKAAHETFSPPSSGPDCDWVLIILKAKRRVNRATL